MTLRTTELFIATVDPKRATVISFPEFISIFGGALSKSRRRPVPKSSRDALVLWLREHRKDLAELLLLPESYDDWNDFDTYSDLLLFEKDLGYLTSAVIVFLEAPGAIAELGAFSQIPSLSERLIIVVANDRHPKKSFISLGPIRSVEVTQSHIKSVCVIPQVKPKDLTAHIPLIVNDYLEIKRKRLRSSETFDGENPQHQILLVLDLVNLFQVVQLTELQALATHFGVNLSQRRTNQILYALQETRLITRQRYGSTDYFIPRSFRQAYVDYTSNTGGPPFNRPKLKFDVWEEIQSNDPYRKNAYESARKLGLIT